jgi:hypothetical protein
LLNSLDAEGNEIIHLSYWETSEDFFKLKNQNIAGHQWLIPIILATWGLRSGELWFEAHLGK